MNNVEDNFLIDVFDGFAQMLIAVFKSNMGLSLLAIFFTISIIYVLRRLLDA